MLQSIKYILFDFSDSFKKEFLGILKKAVWFLLIGIIALIVNEIAPNDVVDTIAAFGFGIYAMFFGISFFRRLIDMSKIISNDIVRLMMYPIAFLIAYFFGLVYSIWGLIKLLIWLIKNKLKNR